MDMPRTPNLDRHSSNSLAIRGRDLIHGNDDERGRYTRNIAGLFLEL